MTAYVESFLIMGTRYAIEDHEDGAGDDNHFFPHRYQAGQAKRFHLWRNGGGFGQADTLQEARVILMDYAVQNVRDAGIAAGTALELADATMSMLGDDVAHLFRFEDRGEKR